MGTESSNPASQNGRLMIVDTDTLMCELLQFRFENEGFETVLHHDGPEALKSDFSQVSLIMVDLMNCEYNGLMFTQFIKRNPDTFNIPVIILSSKASEDDIVDGLDAGADDYIAKPFSSRELVARVRSVLRRKRMMSAQGKQCGALQGSCA